MQWTPDSWRQLQALQQPNYPDQDALNSALNQLRQFPPLVTSWEILQLRQQLAEAAAGKRSVLQGGGCAEPFIDCSPLRIANMLKVLVQMSLVLVVGGERPVIRIGRFAGQYAKPRSADTETREGIELPVYRGDNVNRPEFPAQAPPPDPPFPLPGYRPAPLAPNLLRALGKGGFADLHHPEYF